MPADIGLSRDYGGFDNEMNNEKKSFDFDSILNRRMLVIIIFLVISVCIPFLLYLYIFDEARLPAKLGGVCLVDNSYRIPCGKFNISESTCNDIYCCFEKRTNSCYHNEPSSYYYHLKNAQDVHYISSQENTPLGLPSMEEVEMTYQEDEDSLKILLGGTRTILKKPKISFTNFDVLDNENGKLATTVYRKNTTEMLLTTLKGPLIINEDYLEWTIQLTNVSGVLFGLGGLKIDSKENSTIRRIIYKNEDDHDTLPMFMAYSNEKYHAAIVLHEGALEVTVLPSYLIYLKALYTGNIQIQVIDGPTPKNIYDKIRGKTEKQISYPEWVYGVHICREEPVKDIQAIQDLYESFVSNKNNYPNFAYESECVHDDLLLHLMAENYDESQTKELIQSLGITENFVLSYPPQVPLNSGIFRKFENTSIFYKNATDGSLHIGKYKNFDVVYPIYTHEDIDDLVGEVLGLFEGMKISGFTFTNSWPQDDNYQMLNSTDIFVDKSIQDSFSYTIPWDIKDGSDIHARYHNSYGPTFAKVVETKSTVNLSFWSVSDNNPNRLLITQNLNTSWTDLKASLQSTLFNSIFGRNFFAPPVCGSNVYDQQLQEDLCLRWYLVAATMPLVRVSYRGFPRSPINMFSKYAIEKVISILDTRRSLLPYYRGIINGGSPLVRPMFFNFPKDEKVHDLDEQYMIGDGLLVAQPMSPDVEILKIYLPPHKAWYELWGGQRYMTEKDKEWIKFPVVKSDWVSFLLEGHILPQVKRTASGHEITLRVAMKCSTSTCEADGSVLLEDFGDVIIHFTALGQNISIQPTTVQNMKVKDMIKEICIYDDSTPKDCDDDIDKYII